MEKPRGNKHGMLISLFLWGGMQIGAGLGNRKEDCFVGTAGHNGMWLKLSVGGGVEFGENGDGGQITEKPVPCLGSANIPGSALQKASGFPLFHCICVCL